MKEILFIKVGTYSSQSGFKMIETNILRERDSIPIPSRARKRIIVSIKVIHLKNS